MLSDTVLKPILRLRSIVRQLRTVLTANALMGLLVLPVNPNLPQGATTSSLVNGFGYLLLKDRCQQGSIEAACGLIPLDFTAEVELLIRQYGLDSPGYPLFIDQPASVSAQVMVEPSKTAPEPLKLTDVTEVAPRLAPSTVPAPPAPVTPIPLPAAPVTSPADLDALFEKFSQEFGVPKNTLVTIAKCESGFNPGALGSGMYGGLFQFTASTWSSNRSAMGLDPHPDLRFNAEEAIRTAAFKISRNGTGAWPACSATLL